MGNCPFGVRSIHPVVAELDAFDSRVFDFSLHMAERVSANPMEHQTRQLGDTLVAFSHQGMEPRPRASRGRSAAAVQTVLASTVASKAASKAVAEVPPCDRVDERPGMDGRTAQA